MSVKRGYSEQVFLASAQEVLSALLDNYMNEGTQDTLRKLSKSCRMTRSAVWHPRKIAKLFGGKIDTSISHQ